jgi:hypothetical protein
MGYFRGQAFPATGISGPPILLFPPPRGVNGWSETVAHTRQEKYGSFLGELTMDVARFSRDAKEVAWLTQPVLKNLAVTPGTPSSGSRPSAGSAIRPPNSNPC